MINCLITGVGGQGTVLASKLIAEAAIKSGYRVRTTETIGMAQRGGSVVSHVRIGEAIESPLIAKGQADLIIGFEPAEAVRLLPFLKKGGIVVVNKQPVKPIVNPEAYNVEVVLDFLKEKVEHLEIVDGEALCKLCHNPRGLNIVLLGRSLAVGVLPFSQALMEETIKGKIKQKFIEINLKALEVGYKGGE